MLDVLGDHSMLDCLSAIMKKMLLPTQATNINKEEIALC